MIYDNHLKMNPTMTELVIFGSTQKQQKMKTDSVKVVNDYVHRSKSAKLLGMNLDESLTLKEHIQNKCRLATINIKRIKHNIIFRFLCLSSAKAICSGHLLSHSDHGNSLFADLTDSAINCMARMQNSAAKTIFKLHWLLIRNLKSMC